MKKFNQDQRFYNPTYKNEKGSIQDFLYNYQWTNKDEIPAQFRTEGQQSEEGKYYFLMKKIVEEAKKLKSRRLDIMIEDLDNYFSDPADQKMLNGIKQNALVYKDLFEEVAQEIAEQSGFKQKEYENEMEEENLEDYEGYDQQEILMQQRDQRRDNNQGSTANQVHPLLKRKFDIYFIRGGQSKSNVIKLRELKASTIGSLVTVNGIVIRISEVKPQIVVAAYICESCGFELFQGVSGISFTPMNECQSQKCVTNKMRGKLQMVNQNCLFKSYQEVIIQETNDQLPQGALPRQFLIVCRGENVRLCNPGDQIQIQGIFCPLLDNGYKKSSIQTMDSFVEAFQITLKKKKYSDMSIPQEISDEIADGYDYYEEFYDRLANSIAPEIHGLEDVKKSLLLMMVGGVTLEKKDGLRIRGDINIALIGDPGIAKSQLLKQVSLNAPKSVYTTGKGSSGVGLTASVIKDPNTNEVFLEAGALVLADTGICCIDEFDKMNEHDRTAIHEVMEQQTVSIAKAGITTTLNARTSILAAANPLYSRYRKNLTPQENINMPAALLSRFDLVFILIDKPDENRDFLLAQHIGKLFQNESIQQKDKKTYSNDFMKCFISICKQRQNPTLSPEVHKLINSEYVERRQKQIEKKGENYTTPRTLLSIIRLSTAHAKIRNSNLVEEQDVLEALRLLDVAQESVKEQDQQEQRKARVENIDKIYSEITRLCNYKPNYTIEIESLKKRIHNMGLTEY